MAFLSGGGDESDESVLADINVTPLVDVMLVLLIIFMVATPMLHPGVEVNLPQVEADSAPLRVEDPMVLTVTKDDLIYIKDTPVHASQLADRLLPLMEQRPDDQVFIKGDREVAYGVVMDVLDILHQAGIFQVSLVTEPPPRGRRR